MKTIGLTEGDANFDFYAPWIKGEDPDIEVIILSYNNQNEEDLDRCDGIVLSGGIDTHPRFYNHSRLDYPLAQDFNEMRDEWELKVFDYARAHALPVLAICRGMQLVNVALGGDLIQDLEEHGKENHRRMNGIDGIHTIQVEASSLFHAITQCDIGKVNSAHHQGLGHLAPELMASAFSLDEMVEAIEYKDKKEKPFLIGVQWHPERMHKGDGDIQFSRNIRKAFLDELENH